MPETERAEILYDINDALWTLAWQYGDFEGTGLADRLDELINNATLEFADAIGVK